MAHSTRRVSARFPIGHDIGISDPRFSRSMVLFCTFGTVQSFGVYQAYYSVSTFPTLHFVAIDTRFVLQKVYLSEYVSSDISWIGSVQTFLLFAGGLPAGKLFDEGLVHSILRFYLIITSEQVFPPLHRSRLAHIPVLVS